VTYKPDGYTSVAPYLIVDGAERTIRFLERVFDGVQLRRFDAPEGGIIGIRSMTSGCPGERATRITARGDAATISFAESIRDIGEISRQSASVLV